MSRHLNLNGSGFSNGKNYRIIRYANILLWRAECAIEEKLNLELATDLVNQVRNRAKTSTPVMGLCTSTKNLLIQSGSRLHQTGSQL